MESAIRQAQTDPTMKDLVFDVRWRPYQLNPDAPKGRGVNKMEMYIQKFGKARVDAMLPYMKKTGLEDDIKFSYGGHTGNTFDSHRLIWKAREVGGSELQDKIVESLFQAYFEEEKSMGEVDVLKSCIERAMTTNDNNDTNTAADVTTTLKEFVDDPNNGKDETMEELKEFRRGVSGVPFFIFNNKYSVSGAQPADELLSIFEELS